MIPNAAHQQRDRCHPRQQAAEGGCGGSLGIDDFLLSADGEGQVFQSGFVALGQQQLDLQDDLLHILFAGYLHDGLVDLVTHEAPEHRRRQALHRQG
jgi:hypothetical protein